MTDRGDGFVLVEKRAYERERFLVTPKLIGIHYASRKEQGVVVVWIGLFQRHIYGHGFSPSSKVPPSHLLFGRRNDLSLRPFFFQSFFRCSQFHLLEAIGDQDGDSFSIQLFTHKNSFVAS